MLNPFTPMPHCANCGKFLSYRILTFEDKIFCYKSECQGKYRLLKEFQNLDIDKLPPVNETEIKPAPEANQIKLKPSQNCKMFRCLKCFMYIFPDDSISTYGEGYAHKICLSKVSN